MTELQEYNFQLVHKLGNSQKKVDALSKRPDNSQGKCKKAKLQAGIKPTTLCSAIDKENSIEFLLDFLYYLYNYYMVCALFSHTPHVTWSCDVIL